MLAPEAVSRGLLEAVAAVEDLRLDVPDSPDVVATFVSRAVVDEVVPPSFVDSIPAGTWRAHLALILAFSCLNPHFQKQGAAQAELIGCGESFINCVKTCKMPHQETVQRRKLWGILTCLGQSKYCSRMHVVGPQLSARPRGVYRQRGRRGGATQVRRAA